MPKSPASAIPHPGPAEKDCIPFSPLVMLILIGIVFGLRLYLAATLELHPDEAYYWLWSRHLDWSYFDHPPLIAYLIRATTSIFGHTEFGVRVGGQIVWLLCLGLFWSIGRDLFERYRGWLIGLGAFFLINAAPLFGAGSVIVTPDVPLLLFWTMALAAWARLIATGRGVWWPVLGLSLGLAFIGKYTAVLFGPGLLLWLIISPVGRRWLRTPWPYLGLTMVLIGCLPVVVWNARHDWISITFQAKHGLADHLGLSPLNLFEYLGVQAAAVSPLLFGLFVVAAWLGLWRGIKTRSDSGLMLGLASLPILAFFGLTSLFGLPAQANWPAPAYIAAALATCALLSGKWSRRLTRIGAIVGLIMLFTAQAHMIRPFLPLSAENDRAHEFRLGRQIAFRLEAEIKRIGPTKGLFLLSETHQLLALALFYTRQGFEGRDLTQPWRYL